MALRVVLFLTVLNLFNYTDRFLMSASLVQLKADFSLNDLQSGILFSAFIVPYLFFSLILAYRADRTNRMKVLKVGTLIWSSAAVLAAFAENYYHLLVCRSFLGIGEAAFAAVAPAVVSQISSSNAKAKFMSIFTAALPLGMALGFIGGGYLTGLYSWRFSFLALGLPAFLLSVGFLFLPSKENPSYEEKLSLGKEFRSLLFNRQYMILVLGYAAYMFVAGGVTHWMPSYIVNQHDLSLAKANAIFGGAAIGFGLLGTWVGGVIGDTKHGYLKVSWISMILSLVPFVLVFHATTTTELIIWISLTEFFMFVSTSPITIATLQAASPRQASFAMAMQIFLAHILGDALSAPWIGYISDKTGDLRLALLTCAPMIVLAAGLWWWTSRKANLRSAAKAAS